MSDTARDTIAEILRSYGAPEALSTSYYLIHASAPDRIALARALVADMPGWVVVAEDVGEMPDIKTWDDYRNGERDGWNACRYAMIANGEKNDG